MSDCFVKLALAGEASTKGYRLLKISQPYGVSLEDIKHEALVLYCDTTGTQRSDIESHNFTIDLEFRDNEGDIIIVKTDIDLRNFSASLPSSYIGKVFANVSNTTQHVEAGPIAASSSATTQTETKVEEKNDDDQKIINAISDIFSIAAISMKAGISAAMTAKNLSSTAVKEAQNAHKVSKESLKAAKKIVKQHSKVLHRCLKENGSKSAPSLSVPLEPTLVEDAVEPPLTGRSQEVIDGKYVEKAKDEDVEENRIGENSTSIIPFIHGRHTCDQCLTTPIVGTRYHALNLPDYDLCANCFGNYKGSEIIFEEAQLERDVPFQERWNRKRAMLEGHLKPRMTRRSHCRRGCASVRLSPAVKLESVCGSFAPETVVPPESNGPEALALDEAIRRSLNDVAVLNENDEKEVPVELENTGSAVTTERSEIVVEPDIVVSPGDLQNEGSDCAQETSYATQAIGSGEVAEFVGETLDRMSEAIDELNSDMMVKGDLIFEGDMVQQDGESEYDSDDDSSGSKIVEGEEDAVSTGSWSVVVEREHGATEDGGLGRAAEAIGSALFQSDMMRSIDGQSATMSSVTTVPTVAPSIAISEQPISPFLLQRWASQLEQLHELGFMNDFASVDALESLSAANIGVESSDEVTVEQVIQKLMGD